MNENIFTGILVAVALFVIFAVVVLIPQAVGLVVYRLVKSRAPLAVAALAGFLAPLLLYASVVGYFWFRAAPPAPSGGSTGGEGDLVGLAIALFGFVANACGGLSLYVSLFAQNRRQTPDKNRGGADDLP